MYKLFGICLGVCGVLYNACADATVFAHSHYWPTYSVSSGQVVVNSDVVLEIGEFNFDGIATLINNGALYGRISVCSGCTLYVHNSGVMNTTFNMGTGAQVVQLITTPDEITNLGLDGNFVVNVQSSSELSLNDVLSVSNGADYIVLQDSDVVISGAVGRSGNTPYIDLRGNGALRIDWVDGLKSGVVLRNLGGTGDYMTYVDNVPSLYVAHSQRVGSDVHVSVQRQTNYSIALNNDVGRFLDSVRASGQDDRLFEMLDEAPDMDALNAVMAQSARLNPLNLMRPIRLLQNSMNARPNLGSFGSSSGVLGLNYVMTDDFGIYVLDAGLDMVATDNLSVGIGAHFGFLSLADDVNEFDALLYGGTLSANYKYNAWRANAVAMLTMANFDVGSVWNGTNAVNNPTGLGATLMVDVGRAFEILSDFVLRPFVGIYATYENVVDASESGIDGFLGADLMLHLGGDDIAYEYGARVRRMFDGATDFGVAVAIQSPDDGVIVDLAVTTIGDDISSGYNMRLDARIVF